MTLHWIFVVFSFWGSIRFRGADCDLFAPGLNRPEVLEADQEWFWSPSKTAQAALSLSLLKTAPPSCSVVNGLHYTELDVTQIRARVMPHTALLVSYLCKALLRGGSIAEVWSFISSVWLHLYQDTSGTPGLRLRDTFSSPILKVLLFLRTNTQRQTGPSHMTAGVRESVSLSGWINSRKKGDRQTTQSSVINGRAKSASSGGINITRTSRPHLRLFTPNEYMAADQRQTFNKVCYSYMV